MNMSGVFIPKDGKSILFTNVILFDRTYDQGSEIHAGGVLDWDDLKLLPEYQQYLSEHKGSEIAVKMYSYELRGTSFELRNATKEEMETIIDDDFPSSDLCDGILYCINREDKNKEEVFIAREGYRACIGSDLPICCRMLYDLENQLHGHAGCFGEWLQAAYEINEDFERPLRKMTEEICEAFQWIQNECGSEIAQKLYDDHEIVLPSELRAAARYIHMGGKYETLKELADEGVLLGDSWSSEEMERIADYMNDGGDANNIRFEF